MTATLIPSCRGDAPCLKFSECGATDCPLAYFPLPSLPTSASEADTMLFLAFADLGLTVAQALARVQEIVNLLEERNANL